MYNFKIEDNCCQQVDKNSLTLFFFVNFFILKPIKFIIKI